MIELVDIDDIIRCRSAVSSCLMDTLEAKIVVLGAQGVGKTSLVTRFIGSGFNKEVSPTIGASFFTCKMIIDHVRVKLQVWDTAGQERFRSMAPIYYRKANAAMLVYDITSRDSFHDVESWTKELSKNTDGRLVLSVLGSKCDLGDQRTVPLDEAELYAASIGAPHFDTSALANEGIEDAFLYIAKSLVALKEQGLCDQVSSENPNSGEKVELTQEEDKPPSHWCCSG